MGSYTKSWARREKAALQDHWVFADNLDTVDKASKMAGFANPAMGTTAENYEMALAIAHFTETREKFGFGAKHDAAFNIMLDMYVCLCRSQEVSVGDACVASRISHTSALRVIDQLMERNLLERWDDNGDHRRKLLCLSVEGLLMMNNFLSATGARTAMSPAGERARG